MILDTNAISALLAGDPALDRLLGRAATHELPAIVVGEYLYGLARSRHRRALVPLLEQLVAASTVLAVTASTAAVYATVREALRAKGRAIGENDVWISALALEHDLDVVSRDAHFDQVAGLRRRDW